MVHDTLVNGNLKISQPFRFSKVPTLDEQNMDKQQQQK